MITKGLVAKEPKEEMVKEIVHFLKTTATLDKTKIGEYITDDIELNKEVLYKYIDDYEFNNV